MLKTTEVKQKKSIQRKERKNPHLDTIPTWTHSPFGHTPHLDTLPVWTRSPFGHTPRLDTLPIWTHSPFGHNPHLDTRPPPPSPPSTPTPYQKGGLSSYLIKERFLGHGLTIPVLPPGIHERRVDNGLGHEVGLNVVVGHLEHGVVTQQGLQHLRGVQRQLALPGDLGPHQRVFGAQDLHLGKGREFTVSTSHHTPSASLWHPGSPPGEGEGIHCKYIPSHPISESLAPRISTWGRGGNSL